MDGMSVSEENKILAELEDLFQKKINIDQINDIVSRKYSQLSEDEFLFYLSTACTNILGPEKGWKIAEGIGDYDIRENTFFNIASTCIHSGDTKKAKKLILKMDRTGVMFETIADSLIEKLIQTSNMGQATRLALECIDDKQRASYLLRIGIEYLGNNNRDKALSVLGQIEFDNKTTFENFIGPSEIVMGHTLIWMIAKQAPSTREALQFISLICSQIDDIGNAKRSSELFGSLT